MGRKNKTKLLKHGSQSLNASSIGDLDGRVPTPDNHVPEFEVLSSHLRELVTASPSTSDRHREMKYMFAALEKRDAELSVAKQLIRKLQSGVADHNGDGDSSVVPQDDSYCAAQQSNITEELDRTKQQNDQLIEEREKLAAELKSTEESVQRLKDEMVALETDLENTNKSLVQSQNSSDEAIQALKVSLRLAEAQADSLQKDLDSRQSSFMSVMNELNNEKQLRMDQEHIASKNARLLDEALIDRDQALQLSESAKNDVSVLTATLEHQNNERITIFEKLVSEREKLESRYENINNGVQLIKKDFDDVKKNLIKAKEQKTELQQQLASSKADVKHYRDDADACRSFIKKLEGQLQASNQNSEQTSMQLQAECKQAQEQLLNMQKEMSSYEFMLTNISKELQDDSKPETSDVLTAAKQLKETLRLEQRKQVFNLAAIEAKDAAYQKLVAENTDLLKMNEETEAMRRAQTEIEEENKRLKEEVESSKSLIKKTRKEKDASMKRVKRLLAENATLAEQTKSLEEKMDHSISSSSNESFVSLEGLEESIRTLQANLKDAEEKVEKLTNQLNEKEEENIKLQSEVSSCRSQIDLTDREAREHLEKIMSMKAKLAQLLEASNESQRLFDEASSGWRLKLDSEKYESSKIVEELKSEIEQLKNSINHLETERTQVKELYILTENEKTKLTDDNKSLESQLGDLQKTIIEKEKSSQLVIDEMLKLKESLCSVEEEKKRALEDLSQVSLEMSEHDRSHVEKEKALAELNVKLKEETDDLQTQIMKQDLEIEKLSARITISEQALQNTTSLSEQSIGELKESLKSEQAKCEILEKQIEELSTESSETMRCLKVKGEELEAMKSEFTQNSEELNKTVKQLETELTGAISGKMSINSEVDELKKSIAEKHEEVRKLTEEKSDSDLKQELLEEELRIVTKKLEEAMSPRKDKILQLENRLDVLQTASKAQCKRLEDELLATRTSLEQVSEEKQNLETKLSELHQKSALIDELNASNQIITEELEKAVQLTEVIAGLEKQKKDMQSENAEERAGLVNELIDAKQKLGECEKHIRELQDQLVSTHEECTSVEQVPQEEPEQRRAIDEMFPSMDPAVRQLVILLSENRNYSYGVLGLVIYGFLVHLYILFN